MKLFKIIFFLVLISLISFKGNTSIINYEISSKYNKIFSKNILPDKDIELYQKIFISQVSCNWKIANKYIFRLNNQILMGHVLAQRYLHPKCYRSNFFELASWLERYNDHPQARTIYRLAIKRMPDNYKRPKAPINVIGIEDQQFQNIVNNKYKTKNKLTKNQRSEKQKLINSIKSRVNKGWPTGAAKLLKQRDVKILLDQVEIDQQKELIAKGYYLANKDKLALKYANDALQKSSLYVPYAGWIGGLSSWRLNNYNEAANFFSSFSISLSDDDWHQSSGSFWAARSFAKLNKYKDINFWLNRASKNTDSFYGILASEILGKTKIIDWEDNTNSKISNKELSSLPAIKRIKALIQIGFFDNVEKEIIKINSISNREIALWSLNVAEHFNLAYTQLKVAGKLKKFGINVPIRYFYPTPIWEPLNGFIIQPELLYAFMHQESMFNTDAKSHRGAMGLMQIMPNTAKFISKNKDVKNNNSNILKNPEINLEVGQEYIKYLLKLERVKENLIYLAAAYNGGPGNLRKWQKNTNYMEDPLLFMESIPSRETRWFIEKILTKYWIYQNKFGKKSISLELLANGKYPIY